MSFKREGDDGSQLNLLKKRRVAELLAEDIPDDEAILMSNGRYACTVCHYRPVFDTVDMLTIHRAGKKHQHANDRHFARKRELALLVQKRYHESQLKRAPLQESEDPGPAPLLQKVEAARRHVLLKEAPYNPCHSHRNEGPSTKLKGKLFFQGIQQMQLKNMNQKSPNHGRQNSNPTNQGQHSSNSSDQMQTDSTNRGMQISNSTNQKPQCSNLANQGRQSSNPANQVGAQLSYAQKQQQEKAAMHERIKSFSRQTSAPGVSSIEIKPYIPKARRGKSGIHTNSSKESKQTSTHLPTSSPGKGTHHYMHNNEVAQGESPGQEVANQRVEYISEFQSDMQEHTSTCFTRPRSNVNLCDNSVDSLTAGRYMYVEPRGILKAGNVESSGRLKAGNVEVKQSQQETLIGEKPLMQLAVESERQNARMHEDQRRKIHSEILHSDEGKASERDRQISNLTQKDIRTEILHSCQTAQENERERNIKGNAGRNEKGRNLNLADGQKVEQVEEKRGEAFAPLSREKIPCGGLTFKWKSSQGKSLSRDLGGSTASSHPSKERQTGRTVTDEKQIESNGDGRYNPALQLLNDRQKSGISPKNEKKGFQTCVVSAQTPKEKGRVSREEEERKAGKKRDKVRKDRQKGGQQMSEERRKELQRYLELTSAGWVQDRGGQWVKGQDVEFDSDEEQPS